MVDVAAMAHSVTEGCVTVIAEMFVKVRSIPLTAEIDVQSICPLAAVRVNESDALDDVAAEAARVTVGAAEPLKARSTGYPSFTDGLMSQMFVKSQFAAVYVDKVVICAVDRPVAEHAEVADPIDVFQKLPTHDPVEYTDPT
jgi:hypothetical protein